MKTKDLKITQINDFNILDTEKITLINEAITEAITKQKSSILFEYSNNAIGACLKDLVISSIKQPKILEYKKHRNSVYFKNNDFIFLYRRNNYYINNKIIAKYYKTAKNFIENYNENCKQREFNFDGIKEKRSLNSEKIFLLFLDLDINDLKNNLDPISYGLYLLTIEDEKITDCNNITNIQNISKVHDASNIEKNDIESEIPIIRKTRKKKENIIIKDEDN